MPDGTALYTAEFSAACKTVKIIKKAGKDHEENA